MRYLKGDCVEPDEELARSLFEQAAEKNCAAAQNHLATFYRDTQDDPEKYLTYLENAIQNGYAERSAEFVEAVIHLTTEQRVSNPYGWLQKAEMCAFPYAEKNKEPFLYVFCILRQMRLATYLGLDERGIFLDNPGELSQLCQEFFRNAKKLANAPDRATAETARKWISEIADGVYQAGQTYFRNDQDDKALRCFEIVADESVEASVYLGVCRVALARQNHASPNSPTYSKYLQMLLRAVEHKDEISLPELYAHACHTIALLYRDGYGTAKDVSRSHEFAVKAAACGLADAQVMLSHYRRTFLGGYKYIF